jgi:hypothetical protein
MKVNCLVSVKRFVLKLKVKVKWEVTIKVLCMLLLIAHVAHVIDRGQKDVDGAAD